MLHLPELLFDLSLEGDDPNKYKLKCHRCVRTDIQLIISDLQAGCAEHMGIRAGLNFIYRPNNIIKFQFHIINNCFNSVLDRFIQFNKLKPYIYANIPVKPEELQIAFDNAAVF
jgi:hypothetical protein